jgi:nucleotide-binding universal stress UspA family protein
VDLVVMGTSGEERATEVLTGNNTEQVISISSCPVLSVRDGFNIDDMQRIVLAVSEIESEHVLQGLNTLRQLAECFDAQILLVHVREESGRPAVELQEYLQRMAATAALRNYSITILDGDDPAGSVIAFARENRAGLIAVIKNTKDGLFRIFSNHFSNRLVKEVGRPVFTYNLQYDSKK